ncbi:MAG: hypothetical protein AB7P07_02035 [Hyphomonadaceae bacterium]
MIYHGACHCGAVRVAYETAAAVSLRQDGCSFCASRGVKSASDPNGTLTLESRVALTRYRFGHRSADFLLCPVCGAYVATSMETDAGPIGVINVVGLQIAALKDLPAALSDLQGETPDERIARRRSRWTPMRLTEGAA